MISITFVYCESCTVDENSRILVDYIRIFDVPNVAK